MPTPAYLGDYPPPPDYEPPTSVGGYDKDNEANTNTQRKRKWRKCKWISIAIAVLVVLIVLAVVGIVCYKAASGQGIKSIVNGNGASKVGQQTPVPQPSVTGQAGGQQTSGQPTASTT